MNKVSVVIPVYNQLKITMDCLSDLLLTSQVEIEIIVVDDGSKREPISRIISKVFPQVRVLKNENNLGFAHTVNKGITAASHDLICLLNNDIRLPNPLWLKMMVDNMNKYDITAPAFGRMSLPKYEYLPGEVKENAKINPKELTYAVGWAMLTKKQVFDKVGLIPIEMENFFEDLLWNIRAQRAGFKSIITEGTGVVHYYHHTFKNEGYDLQKLYQEKRKLFLRLLEQENDPRY